jgi:hypothetical protein
MSERSEALASSRETTSSSARKAKYAKLAKKHLHWTDDEIKKNTVFQIKRLLTRKGVLQKQSGTKEKKQEHKEVQTKELKQKPTSTSTMTASESKSKSSRITKDKPLSTVSSLS